MSTSLSNVYNMFQEIHNNNNIVIFILLMFHAKSFNCLDNLYFNQYDGIQNT